MIKLFKRKTNEIKEEFSIGKYNFTIDFENSKIDIKRNLIVDLTIKANDVIFNKFCENDDFEFSFGLYAPEFYARGIDLGKKDQIIINEKNQNNYETALYFMEHNELNVNLSIHPNWVLIVGWTKISGKEYPVSIRIKK